MSGALLGLNQGAGIAAYLLWQKVVRKILNKIKMFSQIVFKFYIRVKTFADIAGRLIVSSDVQFKYASFWLDTTKLLIHLQSSFGWTTKWN